MAQHISAMNKNTFTGPALAMLVAFGTAAVPTLAAAGTHQEAPAMSRMPASMSSAPLISGNCATDAVHASSGPNLHLGKDFHLYNDNGTAVQNPPREVHMVPKQVNGDSWHEARPDLSHDTVKSLGKGPIVLTRDEGGKYSIQGLEHQPSQPASQEAPHHTSYQKGFEFLDQKHVAEGQRKWNRFVSTQDHNYTVQCDGNGNYRLSEPGKNYKFDWHKNETTGGYKGEGRDNKFGNFKVDFDNKGKIVLINLVDQNKTLSGPAITTEMVMPLYMMTSIVAAASTGGSEDHNTQIDLPPVDPVPVVPVVHKAEPARHVAARVSNNCACEAINKLRLDDNTNWALLNASVSDLTRQTQKIADASDRMATAQEDSAASTKVLASVALYTFAGLAALALAAAGAGAIYGFKDVAAALARRRNRNAATPATAAPQSPTPQRKDPQIGGFATPTAEF